MNYFLRNTTTNTRFQVQGQRPRNGKHAMQYVSMEWVKTNAPELLRSVQHDIDNYPTHMCEGHVLDYVFQISV